MGWSESPAYGTAMLLALGMLLAGSASRTRNKLYLLSALGCGLWLVSAWFVLGGPVAAGTAIGLYFFARSTWAFFEGRRSKEATDENKKFSYGEALK
ncbi:MAG: hypothetical protein R2748_34970, partial [Bryobacterales bacterium]